MLARFAPECFLALASPTRAELGICGEQLAARYLKELGWRVLGRRVATAFAELDLVALDGETLVAVEVKAGRVRRKARHAPREHLGRKTLLRQHKAIRSLRAEGAVRVDLVEILLARGAAPELTHLRNLRSLPRSSSESSL